MVTVESDNAKQLLTIRFSGTVTADEIKAATNKIESCLGELQPSFRMLTDSSMLDSMEVGCAPFIRHVMDLCNEKGIGTIYRVIPDARKDIGFNIMSTFHYGPEVQILTYETVEEAAESMENED